MQFLKDRLGNRPVRGIGSDVSAANRRLIKRQLTFGVSALTCLIAVLYILVVGVPSGDIDTSIPSRRLMETDANDAPIIKAVGMAPLDGPDSSTTDLPPQGNYVDENGLCQWEGTNFYPTDLWQYPCNPDAGLLLHVAGVAYMFLALAIVCDEFFCPALEVVVEKMDIDPDMAGATFMAAGGSAPELFTAFIGTYAQSTVGFGTIVGSAVFNILFVIGCCAIFSLEPLTLTAWPLARDVSYYALSLSSLALFFGILTPKEIYWYEAVILLGLYGGYCAVMGNNERLRNFFMPDPTASVEEDGEAPEHKKEKIAAAAGFRGLNFRAGLLQMMVSDMPVYELAGAYMVNKIEGDVTSTFKQIDVDNDGYVDKDEMRQMLTLLSGPMSDEDYEAYWTRLLKDYDTNDDGLISYDEFCVWYLGAEKSMQSNAETMFDRIDTDGSGAIDEDELRVLLKALNGGETVREGQLQEARLELFVENGQWMETVTRHSFIDWYQRSLFSEKEPAGATASGGPPEEEEDQALDLSWPDDTWGKINYVVSLPLILCLVYTLPDVRDEKHKEKYPFTFLGAIMWLGVFSFMMVWWATVIGDALGIPSAVMGLTFLAAGTSVPDLMTSVIVAQQGHGDMAVSSSVGSNIFDVLVGLPLPWLCYAVTSSPNGYVAVVADTLFVSIAILFLMLIVVILTIKYFDWTMTPGLGYTMFLFYAIFVCQDLARQPGLF